ncbi:N-acetyllactosaminide beta-1,3-N-acetylglucosaminyltransferase 2a [Cheilinus undulatus]|uniref:N-acetyllactosaminide beta-1,3-N-acetylglucosaminyltransferase 2a n=1 Tax=Cheilinus undulatus TaxID=241271 RepID=UPI001BD23EA9|nr:N-acetyllactosaminide beta-1,3-N-acetylglucosaminyltransferase 2a [Cheilinus undulatus]
MPMTCRKAIFLCVMFFCLFMVVTWMHRQDQSGQKIRIPTERFWRQTVLSKSFWNREQQLLDFAYNSILNSAHSDGDSVIELPDWLNDTGPLDSCAPDHRIPMQVPDYNTLPERFQDFLLHMRCRSYPLLINQPHVCDENPFLLLVVKSLTSHFDRRQAIRETWGRAGVLANHTVAVVFLLGNTIPSDHQPDLQELLVHEAALHRDILQWDYRDTFFNLTVKEVLFLRWFNQHCPHARFVLKGDDDVLVNTPQIMELLQNMSDSRVKDFFIGDVIKNASPHRNLKLKYSVPESVYVGSYPPYAGGGGYLFSGELAFRLYTTSQQVALYPIDDVYIGMCLQKLGVVPQKHSGFRTFGIDKKHRDNPCVYRGLMLVHSLTPQEMLSVWPWIIHPELDCQ